MMTSTVVRYYAIIPLLSLTLFGANSAVEAQSSITAGYSGSLIEQSRSINTLRSLLIYQGDQLLVEEYFKDARPDRSVNIKSASKSILSLLVGIAVDKGYINDIEEPISSYFEDYFNENSYPQKEQITIKNLLTMQAGLETTSFHNYGRWVISDNWVNYVLDQPMKEEVGGRMIYSTGSSHLLSVILTRATGMSTKEFAQKYLFDPLDIQPGGWDQDPQGNYMGGNNLALTPKDMLKIGQLALNEGSYKGQTVVSRRWLNQSFQTYTRSNFNPYDYGFMWWKKRVSDVEVRFAWGFGGQYIFIIPELNATIVLTNTLRGADQSRSYRDPIFNFLRESILPFIRKEMIDKTY